MINYELTSGDIHLRLIRPEDVDLLWPYVSNPEISKDMSWEAHKTLDQTAEFITNAIASFNSGKSITWCVFYKGTFAGIFSLISILRTHRALTYDRAELAYWLGPEFQGKGIMTAAGTLVLDLAFNVMKLNKLLVGHHTVNDKSKGLILRLGFNPLYREEQVFKKHGEWVDCEFYELKSKDYLKN
ncbi:MAG: alanine acetyltransferase [Flavipsychrobacter sp.]|jgi:RimJ/RimL family protein N-acetyltransferase|nr:alanine acetyltransferase [Flavipsychrobacter sp.]